MVGFNRWFLVTQPMAPKLARVLAVTNGHVHAANRRHTPLPPNAAAISSSSDLQCEARNENVIKTPALSLY
jgi:hypothetical protein